MSKMQEWLAFEKKYKTMEKKLHQTLSSDSCEVKDYYVLYFLGEAENNKLRLNELQEMVGLSQSAMSRLIQRLEANNCNVIQRVTCEDDKRGIYIQLTQDGKKYLEKTTATVQLILDEFF